MVAFPVKGSVVFWHSLKDDGKIDRKSLHGGCPTVHGIKWGTNVKIELYTRLIYAPYVIKGNFLRIVVILDVVNIRVLGETKRKITR